MRIACCLLALLTLPAAAQAQQVLTLEIKDFATVPITGAPLGSLEKASCNEMLLARVNAIREEPGGANRLFVTDMNGPLYILDKKTRQFTKYLDFDGRDDRPGLFHRLFITSGYGNGLNGFHFDPDYRRTGKFYTVHMEDPNLTVSNMPDNKNHPGLNLSGYTTTAIIDTPGVTINEGVLIEWTDTNPANTTFEGTARELMRVRLNTRSHPMGEVTFNPTARAGDPDWRVLYCEVGDGASGESRVVAIRNNPQRLDNLVGKIIRIVPDLNEQVASSTVSENGRYRIPNDNPFVKTKGARPEIWAYGLRNPHRLSWAPDPGQSAIGQADRQLRRLSHVGNGEHHRARQQSRVALSRRQPGAVARSAIACARARTRQDPDADRRRNHRPGHHSEVSGHSVRSRPQGRRCDRQRLCVQRQVDTGSARQIHLWRYHHRPFLVRRLQGNDRGGCRRQTRNARQASTK